MSAIHRMETERMTFDPRDILLQVSNDFLIDALIDAYRDLDQAEARCEELEDRVSDLERRLETSAVRSVAPVEAVLLCRPRTTWDGPPDERDMDVIRRFRWKRRLGGLVAIALVGLAVAGVLGV